MKYIADVRVRKQDRYGNTYHDVRVFDREGDLLAVAEKVYGYGTQYKETTMELIGTECDREDVLFLVHKY